MTDRSMSDARRVAEASLAESAAADGVERVIVGDPVETGRFWVFFFQGRAYVERDDLSAMLVGNAPIAVPKDGSAPFALSSALPADVQLERLRASGAHAGGGDQGGQVRPGGVYVQVRGEWYLSTQTWSGRVTLPWIELRSPVDDTLFRVNPGDVQATTRMTPEVRFAGHWFDLGSLWTASGDRIWGEVDAAHSDCVADLRYRGDRVQEVAALAGARVVDDRGAMGGVVITVRLSDTTGYRETFHEATLEGAG